MRAIYPGSFDPVTNGHLDIIRRAATVFDELVVAVGTNTAKNSLFNPTDRLGLVRGAVEDLSNVSVIQLDGLLVDTCRRLEIGVIVKGLRFGADFDYELQQAHLNTELGLVETVFLPGSRQWGTLSSTMIREVAKMGGPIAAFVPPNVVQHLNLAQGGQTS